MSQWLIGGSCWFTALLKGVSYMDVPEISWRIWNSEPLSQITESTIGWIRIFTTRICVSSKNRLQWTYSWEFNGMIWWAMELGLLDWCDNRSIMLGAVSDMLLDLGAWDELIPRITMNCPFSYVYFQLSTIVTILVSQHCKMQITESQLSVGLPSRSFGGISFIYGVLWYLLASSHARRVQTIKLSDWRV